MGWILEFVGVFVGSAVVPITLAVVSAHVPPLYAALVPPITTLCSIAAWLGVAKGLYGAVNLDTTYENWPMFAGCIVGIALPLLIWVVIRPFCRTPYDWDRLYRMDALEPRPGDSAFEHGDEEDLGHDWDPKALARASWMAKWVTAILCIIFLVIIPFPMYGAGYIMSRKFFIGWTVLVFLWGWLAALVILGLPIWQSRGPIMKVMKGIFGGKRNKITTIGQPPQVADSDKQASITEKGITG